MENIITNIMKSAAGFYLGQSIKANGFWQPYARLSGYYYSKWECSLDNEIIISMADAADEVVEELAKIAALKGKQHSLIPVRAAFLKEALEELSNYRMPEIKWNYDPDAAVDNAIIR
jgi:hypothetical protein